MQSKKLTPEVWYHRLGTDFVVAQILFHFNSTGVFQDLVAHAPTSSKAIAERLKLDPRLLEVLLDYLANVDEIIDQDSSGLYFITEFGKAVLARFSKKEENKTLYNFHEVRVGAFAPVWDALGGLLTGKWVYGKDVKRRGEYAEEGVYVLAQKFGPPLVEALKKLKLGSALEIGVNAGLTEQLGLHFKNLNLYGADLSAKAIAKAESRYLEVVGATPKVQWLECNIFKTEEWLPKVDRSGPLALFSIHFHEIVGQGLDPLIGLLKSIRASGIKGYVLMMEQPRLDRSLKGETPEHLWLYNHSNIVIHHVIGNGKILGADEWIEVFKKGGSKLISKTKTGYLGYELFIFEI
jgi:hypothetical protein